MAAAPTTQIPQAPRFAGFVRPEQNWFRLPSDWTDITAGITSLAELKVVEYVLKHTWGYQEYGVTKQITTDEFMYGRLRKDGTRMDVGTGLSNRSVIDGLKHAVQHGYLIEEVDASDRGRVKKYYALKMRAPETRTGDQTELPPDNHESSRAGVKNLHISQKHLHPDVKNLHPSGKESSHRTEKDTLERYLKKPLNGDNSIFKKLPNLDQPPEKTQYVADFILESLGDKQSSRFYKLIAAKISEHVIREILSAINADGARDPAKLFTYKIKQYAQRYILHQQKQRIGNG
jgi:hypothetical protein